MFDPGHAFTAWYTSQGIHHMVHSMFNAGHWITLGVDVWSIGHFVAVVLGHYHFLDPYTDSGHGSYLHHVRCYFLLGSCIMNKTMVEGCIPFWVVHRDSCMLVHPG